MPFEVQSMDGRGSEQHQPPPKSELDKISRGSMLKVIDPETNVWYWVVVERRLKDPHWFQGRIDAGCIGAPTLRHGGTAMFHEDNVLYIWPAKVHPMFNKMWFRILSHFISMGAGVKALKLPQTP